MNVIDAANQLALALSESKEIKDLSEARYAYTHNDLLAEKAKEYMVQSTALEEEMKKGNDADKDVLVAIKDRMTQLGAELNESEDIVRLRNAEKAANELLTNVNSMLDKAIRGEEDDACSHDCSHCSGCH